MGNHNNLKQTRAKALLSKAELARKAGVSVLTISRIEDGLPDGNQEEGYSSVGI